MEVVLHIFGCAALGLVAGVLGGFLAAVATLQAKRIRNVVLLAKGQPGFKDCVLPVAMIGMTALCAALLSGGLAPWVNMMTAVMLGSAIPAGGFLLLGVLSSLWQAWR